MLRFKGGTYQDASPLVYPQGLYEESATQKCRLGLIRPLDDGRVFIYASITAAAITAGAFVSKVQTPVDATIAAADAALNLIGRKEITLTIAGATANLYADGWILIKAGAGIGEMYKVRGNTATGDPATGRATFYLYDALRTTHVAASTTVAAHQSPYANLLINPAVANEAATTQETVLGLTHMAMGNSSAVSYVWLQKEGIASAVLDIDKAAGEEANEMAVVLGTTAGRGAVIADTAYAGGVQILGYTLESADLTDAEANLIMLRL
jgi:hypothetical protein